MRSFVREQGTGPAVLCLHGMVGSSFLYRKVLAELAGLGLRGVAFDLPGFGLAERQPGYDYSWTGSPWTMQPFRHRGVGEMWMRSLNGPAFRFLMRLQGIGDPAAVSNDPGVGSTARKSG